MSEGKDNSRLLRAVGSIWLLAGLLVGLLAIIGVYFVLSPDQPQTITEAPLVEETAATFAPSETPKPEILLPPTHTPQIAMATPTPPLTQIPSPTPTPTFATYFEGPMVIGYSVDNRPLEVYRFGRGPNAYMVVAGIHGGYEINTVMLADELIQYLAVRPELIPESSTLYILRAMNPDGLVYANQKEGRANFNNVDLNRNFTFLWSETWSRVGCWDYLDITSGTHPASEPETIALMAFILEHPIVALVSYHSAAPGIYPAGKIPYDDADHLSRDLSKASGYPYPAFDPGCQMSGTLVDWVATTGAAAADVELSNHWNTDFEVNLKLVLELVNWSHDD